LVPTRGLYRGSIGLHKKGGEQHAMPCRQALAEALRTYIVGSGYHKLFC